MWWWIRELLGSVRFLSASGQEPFWHSKRVYEVVIPSVFALVGLALALLFPKLFAADILSKLSGSLFQFMVFVVPFHLAALAAIATFARPNLDQYLRGAKVEIRVWDNKNNEYFLKPLTLRQYTCLLFGYLCSIGVGFIIIFVVLSGVNLSWLLGDWLGFASKVVLFLLLFFLAHYGTLSIYAITFLFDKVNAIDDP